MTTSDLEFTAHMALKRTASFSMTLDVIAALRQARIEYGENVVVVGDGPQSYIASQIAQINGAARVEHVRLQNLDAVTKRCADVLIYASQNMRPFASALHIARNNGRVVLLDSQPDMPIYVNVYPDIHKRSLQVICTESYFAASGSLINFTQDLIDAGRLRLEK